MADLEVDEARGTLRVALQVRPVFICGFLILEKNIELNLTLLHRLQYIYIWNIYRQDMWCWHAI